VNTLKESGGRWQSERAVLAGSAGEAFNWDDGRLFLAVGRAGQMLAASRKLGLNQATLSRRIAGLERSLGVKLLVRRTHGCELTDAGAALMGSLERIEAEIRASQAWLKRSEATVSGLVRVGAPDGFGTGFLAARLVRLTERHPDLRIQLVPTPRGFSLSRREADIAVMVGRPERGCLVARKLTDYTLGLYAARSYLLRHPAPGTTAELNEHRLVGHVEDLLPVPALNHAPAFLRSWRSHFEIHGAIGQLEAVRSGAGIGVLQDYLAGAHPELVPVLPDQKAVRSYWTAVHENLRDVPRVGAAADFLVEIVREAEALFAGPGRQ
jgi:DNA-binding transcriptional LysR family regulator